MRNNKFYNDLSSDYDSMLNIDKVINNRTSSLKKFIKREYKNAIDIGCGTGADSIALAMNGLNVNGYDTSEKMIKKAKLNAKGKNLKIRFSNSPVQDIKSTYNSKIDIVVSLGNAVANINTVTLNSIIRKVHKLLKTNGIFIIQILNYELIRKSNKRIVNITKSKDSLFIRFYDFAKNKLIFNVLRINNSSQDFSLISTELFEHKRNNLKAILKQAGFSGIRFYSDLNESLFNSKESKDLIIIAKK